MPAIARGEACRFRPLDYEVCSHMYLSSKTLFLTPLIWIPGIPPEAAETLSYSVTITLCTAGSLGQGLNSSQAGYLCARPKARGL